MRRAGVGGERARRLGRGAPGALHERRPRQAPWRARSSSAADFRGREDGAAGSRRGGARVEHGVARLGKRPGIVAAEVQAAAFLAREGGAHDELGGDHEVAQLDQVVGDAEVGVELVDLALQQLDAVQRALEALVGAHDAHVAPHRAAQLVPVVRDHHFLVGVRDAAFVPRRQGRDGDGGWREDVRGGGLREDEAFEERVGGEAVGAVQPRAGHFAQGVEARHGRAPARSTCRPPQV